MFVLRKITGNGVEINISLGGAYTLVHSVHNPQDFKVYAEHEHCNVESDGIYAFVSGYDGRDIIPLYKSQKNYIMTGRGDTFADVSA